MAFARTLPGVELVLDKEQVCKQFELPIDREGDFAVFSDRKTVVGARREDHNLSQLAGHRLRSHGGLGQQKVPFTCHGPEVDKEEYGKEAGEERGTAPQLRYLRFCAERGSVSHRSAIRITFGAFGTSTNQRVLGIMRTAKAAVYEAPNTPSS